jgi:glycosyltransferase involved in cell wall biosynthesis
MNDRKTPLVSCIMPTKNRRPWVVQSLKMFARQTYPNRELIIVDDGDDNLEDVVLGIPGVSYVVLGQHDPINLGQHRNLACERARGEYILHWDDDDWQHPERIALQVEAMQANPDADICGTDQALYYQVESGQARRYRYPQDSPMKFVLGNTFCYRRGFWLRKPFNSTVVFEDNTFLSSTPRPHVHVLDRDLLVAMAHSRNYSPKNFNHPVWHPVLQLECERFLQDDREFYDSFRSASAETAVQREEANDED